MKNLRYLNLLGAMLAVILLTLSSPLLAAKSTPRPMVAQDIVESIDMEDEDPWEGFNRAIFELNRFFDTLLFHPLAEIYNATLPEPVQQGIHNFLVNLTNPITFINNVAQADGSSAMDTLARFLMNSTLGLGGLFDVAASFGLDDQPADFGITLGKAGMGSGPYLILPFIGPATVRDALGWGIDWVVDPTNYYLRTSHAINRHQQRHRRGKRLIYARTGMDYLDRRAKALDFTRNIDETSTDPYVTYRSYYLQHRRFKIAPQAALEADSPTPYVENEKK